MRAFAIGLFFGCAIGAGGMFFALRLQVGPSVKTAEPISTTKVDSTATATKSSTRKKSSRPTKRRAGGAGGVTANPCGPIEISMAQRQETWRGPTVSLPAKSVDFERGESGSSLSSAQINAGIGGARGKLTECIAKARGRAEIAASIKLRFLVDGNGRIGAVRLRAPTYLHEQGVLGCVRGALESASFAATGSPTVVNLPFKLSFSLDR